MKKWNGNPVKVGNLLCALLMALLVVLQFVPFWNVEGEGISAMGYLGFPDDHSNLTSWLNQSVEGGFEINQIVGWVFFGTVACIVGVILCVKYREKAPAALMPVMAGILGLLYCATEPAFRMGSVWVLHLVLYILLLGLAVMVLAAKKTTE